MTILREEEHRALSTLMLTGKVADLGGDTRSAYHRCIKGSRDVHTINIDANANPSTVADLEQPLPLLSASFDGVLLMNVLEHVFHAQQLLHESSRILKPGGKLILAVPYVFPYHASPNDYYRFSKDALTKMLRTAGFKDIVLMPLGSGVASAQFCLIERLLPGALQRLLGPVLHPLIRAEDWFIALVARALKKQYASEDYALGFVATASI